MLFSVEQGVGGGAGGDEKRAPLKTPAWEAKWNIAKNYVRFESCYTSIPY